MSICGSSKNGERRSLPWRLLLILLEWRESLFLHTTGRQSCLEANTSKILPWIDYMRAECFQICCLHASYRCWCWSRFVYWSLIDLRKPKMWQVEQRQGCSLWRRWVVVCCGIGGIDQGQQWECNGIDSRRRAVVKQIVLVNLTQAVRPDVSIVAGATANTTS